MSLKGIELQIAIPKTFDAGKIAEQKQQQSQLNNDQAAANTDRQTIKNRETVLESEKYAALDGETNESEQEQMKDQQKKQQQDEEKKTVHPYKGSFVDFIG